MKYKMRPCRAKKLIIKAIENNNYYPETGYLQVKVQDLLNNEPIKDALVRISLVTLSGLYNEYAEGNLIDEYRTDESGNIPITRLQAYNELNSENKIYMIATLIAALHHQTELSMIDQALNILIPRPQEVSLSFLLFHVC